MINRLLGHRLNSLSSIRDLLMTLVQLCQLLSSSEVESFFTDGSLADDCSDSSFDNEPFSVSQSSNSDDSFVPDSLDDDDFQVFFDNL